MTDESTPRSYDAPGEVAASIVALDKPTLVVFDCDGVLAPLTDHANDSVLTEGVGADLERLAELPTLRVAVLSGRSLDGLEQFEFAPQLTVWGSYGAERRGAAGPELSPVETERLAELDALLTDAAARAGDGAWVERKPTSVVIHVREADPERGRAALDWVRGRQAHLEGHTCHEGSNVLELMTRAADKGSALDELRSEFGPATTVYIGDDVPDEDAFARLGSGDLGIKVGDGPTIAAFRLRSPREVRTMLEALTERMTSRGPIG